MTTATTTPQTTTTNPRPIVLTEPVQFVMLRALFFDVLSFDLERVTVRRDDARFLCWRSKDGRVGHARIETAFVPGNPQAERAAIVRVTINDGGSAGVKDVAYVARQSGIFGDREEVATPTWSIEVCVLLTELLACTQFFASLVHAHEEDDATLVRQPPVPITFPQATPFSWTCGWSAAASEAMKKHIERLGQRAWSMALPEQVRSERR